VLLRQPSDAGPTVLSVLLLTAIVVNFVLRFNE